MMTDSNPMPTLSGDDSAAGGVSTREKSRQSLFLTAEVEVEGRSEPLKVRVRNLSAGGMLAEAARDVPVGAVLRVELANVGRIGARCIWSGVGRFGVAFDQLIDPEAARRKLTRSSDLPPTLLDMTLHTSRFKKPLRPI